MPNSSRDEIADAGHNTVAHYLAQHQLMWGPNFARDLADGAIGGALKMIIEAHGVRAGFEVLQLHMDAVTQLMAEENAKVEATRGKP